VHFSYRRYLANQLRESFELDGTPVRIVCRKKGEKGRPSRRKKESEKTD
jgi:predicted GTPase